MQLFSFRSIFVAALMSLFCLTAQADDTYGAGLSDEAVVVEMSELAANPDKYDGKLVRIEGVVKEVCPMRGCWMTLAYTSETGSTDANANTSGVIRFKVKDGKIVIPVAAEGHQATAEGIFTIVEMTKDEAIAKAKHYAVEKGVEFDPSTVTGPEKMFLLRGTGAVIK